MRCIKKQRNYVNIHYDCKGSSIDVHNDQKKYRWLITGQMYLDGDINDGVILQDHKLNEVTKIPLKPNLLYAIATSMYSWHVNPIVKDKICVLFRFGKKQINTITNYNKNEKYCIVIDNDNQLDSHYAKIGMRMSKLTESWLYEQGYSKHVRLARGQNTQPNRCSKKFDNLRIFWTARLVKK